MTQTNITECKDNTYGMDCSMVCGNCLNGEQCNHVNGSCHDGCDKGTHGDKCDIGWYNCYFYHSVVWMYKVIYFPFSKSRKTYLGII